MPIAVKAYANADDVLIAWEPDTWSKDWVGFKVERRDDVSGQVTVLVNRIPPQAGAGAVQTAGVSSAESPIRRCIWTDHDAVSTDNVSYRVTAMKGAGTAGTFAPDASSASEWSAPTVATGDAGGGLSAFFNRGTLMSQIVSRFVNKDTSEQALRAFVKNLATPGGSARQYLAGDALHQILTFLGEANRRGGTVFAALYEINDQQLINALKAFGPRGHVLIGNGSATASTSPPVADQLTEAGVVVKHRDLSHAGKSSPSVHNKFVVEADASGNSASRVLTGSTNWTTTGLCTQLNNVLIVEDTTIAGRFRKQWDLLVAAGDDMTPSLQTSNTTPTTSGAATLYFAATHGEAEFKPVLDLIAGAKEGVVFLMFMPGQSPLLKALLDRVQENKVYVRGVVSSVTPSSTGVTSMGGQVVKSGAPAQAFHRDVLLPAGISAEDDPSWEDSEFTVQEIRSAGMMAIVHSKTIVIDPFSPDCAVITGSHNFSDSASAKNDENLVIIRGNQRLAQAYAVHINGVYDHYSWRAFLASGGKADQIYQPLDGWMPGGSRAQELAFWLGGPTPAQAGDVGAASPKAAPTKVPRAKAPPAKAQASKASPAKARATKARTAKAGAGRRPIAAKTSKRAKASPKKAAVAKPKRRAAAKAGKRQPSLRR
jgi:phosphatidylserine/phosphatidylglycerophosphate/cardiolipin synthase-like enzyme